MRQIGSLKSNNVESPKKDAGEIRDREADISEDLILTPISGYS